MLYVIIVGLEGCLKITNFGNFMGNQRLQRRLLNVGVLVQETLNQYGDFRGMLHDLYPTHEMAPEPVEQGESVQHNRLKSKSIEAAVKRAVVYEKVYNTKDGTHVTVRARENIARMKEILNEEGTPLQGESSGGILWSKDDAFARVMGLERSDVYVGWVLDEPHQEEVGQPFHNIY
ncbi:hypothetical protein SO802_016509 [Lithocarpus litseifolius]|uniref:Uncharacterized protein n=1 Tax=Lithocarpus litseifolius TaxID=425828 RepID=A0AAW2CYY8_9ROSI